MKLSTCATLAFLLNTVEIEATTWRSPPSLVPRKSQWSSPPTWSLPRGGADTIPSRICVDPVLKNSLNSNLSGDVARGGSTSTTTTTRQQQPSDLINATDISGGASTPAAVQQPATSIDTQAAISTAIPAAVDPELQEVEVVSSTAVISKKVLKQEQKIAKKLEKKHKHIAKKLKNRNHQNIRRKILHASFGLFFSSCNHLVPKHIFLPIMTVVSVGTLAMELLRYKPGFHWMNQVLFFCLGNSLRKHEMDGKFTGSLYYFVGVTLTSAIYSKPCATLGILQLAIADPTASYFGRRTRHVYWSRIENGLGGFGRNKGLLGFIGGALCCVPMNYRILSLAKFGATAVVPTQKALIAASVALGIAGSLADLSVPTPSLTLPKKVCGVKVPPFHVDDNFVVPLFSALACTKIFDYLGFGEVVLSKFLFL